MTCRFASAALLLSLALPLSAAERVQSGAGAQLSEARVEIFNAVGTVALHSTSGNAVTVTATAQGSDGSQLVFETDHDGSLGRFRVVFPDVDRIATPPEVSRHSTPGDLNLRRDGTFGGDHGWRRDDDRVRIGGSSGLQAWAAVEIGIPDGANVKVHLAVGRANADGANGTIVIDAWSADTEATNIAGDWLFDSGSGNVTVHGMRGTLRADTGSGDVVLSDLSGDLFDADTGSGSVEATDVQVDRFRFDTGSGDVRASNLVAARGLVDTAAVRRTSSSPVARSTTCRSIRAPGASALACHPLSTPGFRSMPAAATQASNEMTQPSSGGTTTIRCSGLGRGGDGCASTPVVETWRFGSGRPSVRYR